MPIVSRLDVIKAINAALDHMEEIPELEEDRDALRESINVLATVPNWPDGLGEVEP